MMMKRFSRDEFQRRRQSPRELAGTMRLAILTAPRQTNSARIKSPPMKLDANQGLNVPRRQTRRLQALHEMRDRCRGFLSRIVVVDLQQHAAVRRLEWPVIDARRTAGITMLRIGNAVVAVLVAAYNEVAGNDVDLFPIFVNEGPGREDSRGKAQQARARAGLVHLIQVTGEDLM